MILELRVVHTVDPEVLAVFKGIQTEVTKMNDHLTASLEALKAQLATDATTLDNIRAAIPGLIQTAVTTALANANVEEEAAATALDQTLADLQPHIDALEAATQPVPAPAPEPAPEPSAGDVVATGAAHGDVAGDATTEAPAGDAPVAGDPAPDAPSE